VGNGRILAFPLRGMAQQQTSVFASFKGILDGKLDGASADEKSKAVTQLIRRASSRSALLALEPIPFLDTAIFTHAQHRLLQSIARLHGYHLDDKQAREAFAMFRSRLLKPNLIVAAAKLITFLPVLPELWAGSMVYAMTGAVGELSDQYFGGGRAMSADEIETTFDRLYERIRREAQSAKRKELSAMFRNKEVRHAVRDIKRAFRDGTIGAEEALRRSEEILDR
jgi:uncharacterized protein (DUF697 family)